MDQKFIQCSTAWGSQHHQWYKTVYTILYFFIPLALINSILNVLEHTCTRFFFEKVNLSIRLALSPKKYLVNISRGNPDPYAEEYVSASPNVLVYKLILAKSDAD